MQKAFSKVPHVHKMLLTKLRGYGIHGRLLDWIKDLLRDRTWYVIVNVGGECSEEVAVTSGVPQRNVLGPTLFTLLQY